MPSDWMPGVKQIRSSHNGGSMTGGPPRMVWHSYEADPNKVSATKGAQSLIAAGNEVQLVFNPITGELVQILSASVAGRGLVNLSGGVETNRMGDTCIQCEVIAYAAHPWTDYITPAGTDTLASMMDWIRSFDIPDVWPSGPPPVYPPGNGNRSQDHWLHDAGHYSHSQVPENTHGDPGAIDIDVLFGAGMALTQADYDGISNDNWNGIQIPNKVGDHSSASNPANPTATQTPANAVSMAGRWAEWGLWVVKDGPDSNSALHTAINNISVTLSAQDKQDIIDGVVAAMNADIVATMKDAVTQVLREGVTAQPLG